MAVLRVPADFRTIGEAVQRANPGDTIRVAGGVFAEPVSIGTGKDRLAIIGSGPGNAILQGPGGGVGFDINGSGFVTIRGFTVTGFERGVQIGTGDNLIHGVAVTGNSESGIFVAQSGARNLILGVESSRNGGHGVEVRGSSNYVLAGEFHHNEGAGIAISGPNNLALGNRASGNAFGLESTGGNTTAIGNDFTGNGEGISLVSQGHLVFDNVLSRSARTGAELVSAENAAVFANRVSCNQGAGIRVREGLGNRVIGNRVEGSLQQGIDLVAALDGVVDDNAVKGNDAAGIRVCGRSAGNAVRRNRLKRNNPDIEAVPPADRNNVFDENRCRTSAPEGVCRKEGD